MDSADPQNCSEWRVWARGRLVGKPHPWWLKKGFKMDLMMMMTMYLYYNFPFFVLYVILDVRLETYSTTFLSPKWKIA